MKTITPEMKDQIFRLSKRGMQPQEIADRLKISKSSAVTHMAPSARANRSNRRLP